MKRALLTGPGQFVLEETPKPSPQAGEALVRITAVGVCGSDMHMFKEGNIGGICLEAGRPAVVGHEAVGVVEAVGSGGEASQVGQRVLVEPAIPCGRCPWCLAGKANVCPHHEFLGLPPKDGALQEYMVHPAHLCAPIPEELSDDQAVLLEPLAIALHAIDRVNFRPGSAAAVLGSGPIGLSVLMLLHEMGCHPLIATDKLEYRLDFARQMGATHTLNPRRDDVVARVHELTGGYGSAYTFEAAGDAETFRQMVAAAGPAGQVAVLGIPAKDEIAFQASVARRKGLDVRMIRRSNRTTERAMAWALRNHMPLGKLATHHWPMSQVQQAFETVAAYADGVVKGIVKP